MATRPVDCRGVNPTTIRTLRPTRHQHHPRPIVPLDRRWQRVAPIRRAIRPKWSTRPTPNPQPAQPRRRHRRQPELAREPRRLCRRLLPRLQHRMDPRHPICERVPHRPVKPLPLLPRILCRVHRQHVPANRRPEPPIVRLAQLRERLPLRSRSRSLQKRYARRYALPIPPPTLTRTPLPLRIRTINPPSHTNPPAQSRGSFLRQP